MREYSDTMSAPRLLLFSVSLSKVSNVSMYHRVHGEDTSILLLNVATFPLRQCVSQLVRTKTRKLITGSRRERVTRIAH